MARTTIADNTIWLKHIQGDRALQQRLRTLRSGDLIDLEVNGIVGRWERMRDGKDGRPTEGIKPVDSMKKIWTQLQKQRGKVVEIREVMSADTYLAALGETLSEWDSPEDEEAYRDL